MTRNRKLSVKTVSHSGWVSASVLLLIILLYFAPWRIFAYRGDGRFLDFGILGNPRYSIRFPDLPLYEGSDHHFRFRGLPNEEMTLKFHVKDRSVDTSEEQRAPLEQLHVTIEARLTSREGQEICHALGEPSSGNRDGIWVLESGGDASYWHWQCNHVLVNPKDEYELTVRVMNVDPKREHVVVVPSFEGGGLDLP